MEFPFVQKIPLRVFYLNLVAALQELVALQQECCRTRWQHRNAFSHKSRRFFEKKICVRVTKCTKDADKNRTGIFSSFFNSQDSCRDVMRVAGWLCMQFANFFCAPSLATFQGQRNRKDIHKTSWLRLVFFNVLRDLGCTKLIRRISDFIITIDLLILHIDAISVFKFLQESIKKWLRNQFVNLFYFFNY